MTIDRTDSRELSLDILMEILEKGAYSHVVLKEALGKYQFLSKSDRAFITRVTEGTLERLIGIDWILDRYSKTKVKKMKPFIRTLLRMSVYQILYMDRVPDAAVCNEAVKLAVKRRFGGLKGFVNGILRTVVREKAQLAAAFSGTQAGEGKDAAAIRGVPDHVRYSIPDWLFSMWTKELGRDKALGTAKAFFRERPTTVRCNTSLASMERIQESLTEQGVSWEASPYPAKALLLKEYDYLESLEAFQKGQIQVEDLSCILAMEGASLKEGDHVIDVCAAPGGKSLHIAEELKGTGMVEARDLTEKKIRLIEENIRRTGFSNIRTRVMDARVLDEASVEKADVVLADLPCSGLGIIGKKPDIKLHMTPEKIESLVGLQREILSTVWRYVKPGGILVYSTCTIHQAENQDNVDWFLESYPFERVDLAGRFGALVQAGSLKDGWMQFLPGDGPWDGFFVAVLRRSSTFHPHADGQIGAGA